MPNIAEKLEKIKLYYYCPSARKEAAARVRLMPGAPAGFFESLKADAKKIYRISGRKRKKSGASGFILRLLFKAGSKRESGGFWGKNRALLQKYPKRSKRILKFLGVLDCCFRGASKRADRRGFFAAAGAL